MHKYTLICTDYEEIVDHFKDPNQFCIEPFIEGVEPYEMLLTGSLSDTKIVCIRNERMLYGCYCSMYKSRELTLPEFKLVDILHQLNKYELNINILDRRQLTRANFEIFKSSCKAIMIKSQFQIIHNNLISKDWVKVICH